MTEYQMQAHFMGALELLGYSVYAEVPFLSRSIDVVAEKNGKFISVELKLTDWKKAIRQSKDHSLGADEAYICMPVLNSIPDQLLFELQWNGLGLMFFNPETNRVDEIVPPQRCSNWPPARAWLIESTDWSTRPWQK